MVFHVSFSWSKWAWALGEWLQQSYLSMRLLRWSRRGFKFWNCGIHNGNQNFSWQTRALRNWKQLQQSTQHASGISVTHRGQAFERWVNRAANGVTPTTRNLVLDSMKRLAYAPTGTYHNNHYTHLHCMFIPNIYTPLTTYRYMNAFKQFWVRSRCSLGTLTTPNCRNTSRMNGWTVNQWVQNSVQ